ncbi:hypothetical protein FA95DRAFT_865581 [Auriscalpium vulgare]|uniref:Uncharacterized protein n=1 Tax=Auriscalpium vulgare TaxID=40419 RepID=A0ACB8RA68_9AGAM|nr:hypothetical protein FA95DRAFT_865581 [Auriscalpium vulgare]
MENAAAAPALAPSPAPPTPPPKDASPLERTIDIAPLRDAASSSAPQDEPAPLMRILGVNYVPEPAEDGARVEASSGEAVDLDLEGDGSEGGGGRRTDVHPLRLDIHPPSPPPWEVIVPPSTNGHGFGNSDWHSSQHETASFHKKNAARRMIPKSSYYFGPPAAGSAYGTPPVGQLGVHHPREIVRVERDYSGGEVMQFAPTYPLEFDRRITPTQFLESINAMNEILISAHSLRHSLLDNLVDILSLRAARLVVSTHYEREMRRLKFLIDDLNRDLYNPVGLHILWPRSVGFLFVSLITREWAHF